MVQEIARSISGPGPVERVMPLETRIHPRLDPSLGVSVNIKHEQDPIHAWNLASPRTLRTSDPMLDAVGGHGGAGAPLGACPGALGLLQGSEQSGDI